MLFDLYIYAAIVAGLVWLIGSGVSHGKRVETIQRDILSNHLTTVMRQKHQLSRGRNKP